MSTPLVSIISVNYNQARITCEMLASLSKITYPNIEVIVVDNASPTDNPDIIKEQYPDVNLIRSSVNLGYAGGNNLGIVQAKGKYLFFLNNDTEVDSDFLEPLVAFFEATPNAGIASPKIKFFDSNNIIQYAGSTGINPWTGRSKTIGNQEADLGQHNHSIATNLADGAAMMIPMEVVKKVGLMPEIYFLYYEEHDWCEMIKRAGYSCHYIAESAIYHKESMSVGKMSVLKTYYLNRNRLLFIRRNFKGKQFYMSAVFFFLLALPKNSLVFGINRQWQHLKALWTGLLWHIQPNRVHQNIVFTNMNSNNFN
ncbi:dTDP-Rha--alpha-D-GlcNAc-pyrophosphate polyprenol alpha-3-L-rhamnosyltransferase [Adhaeribacter arboris]|uniref:dTDP-Rha--alpha-D-GlcNAc-pyrophosphate polyprenol alpha-3-L-rhamnosyltransferase n=1 Tax=Adhaeribacter arboris TaxID=2072846 RepID=A0A2T2YMC4_9BACT|nr:glycosyltransferase family 2 protein [Adhaeribacter arboris]PSR56662.1 dTDP-Rha--alpha-D-GlcNAc-pyrophosphate polyprenol alpha-3-L-rhamnosyltransferase [Adhaeribacter arboris]